MRSSENNCDQLRWFERQAGRPSENNCDGLRGKRDEAADSRPN